jgi:16S rRNA processing protein RimM
MKQLTDMIECGRIVTTHGVRGSVKVEPWCDSPTVLAHFDRVYLKDGASYQAHKVTGAFCQGAQVVLTLSEIDTMDKALALKGQLLYAHRSQIPVSDGAMLLCDMVGLAVIDAVSGEKYGTLIRIEDAPASQIYVVGTPHGEVLLPAVPVFIKEVNPEKGVLVTPIPGFFDDI